MASRPSPIVSVCFGITSLATALMSAAAPASAQTGRCTGVLCDLYYANRPAPVAVAPGQPAPPEPPDPTHLPCHDFLCAAFGGRTPDPAPPPPEPVAAPEPTKPVKAAKRRHKAAKTVAAAEAPKSGEAPPAR